MNDGATGSTRDTGSGATAIKALSAVVALVAIGVAATTGDSWAVRTILVLVAGDIAVRLWRTA